MKKSKITMTILIIILTTNIALAGVCIECVVVGGRIISGQYNGVTYQDGVPVRNDDMDSILLDDWAPLQVVDEKQQQLDLGKKSEEGVDFSVHYYCPNISSSLTGVCVE